MWGESRPNVLENDIKKRLCSREERKKSEDVRFDPDNPEIEYWEKLNRCESSRM